MRQRHQQITAVVGDLLVVPKFLERRVDLLLAEAVAHHAQKIGKILVVVARLQRKQHPEEQVPIVIGVHLADEIIGQYIEERLAALIGGFEQQRRFKVDLRARNAADALKNIHHALLFPIFQLAVLREDIAAQDVAGALDVERKAERFLHLEEEEVGNGLGQHLLHGALAQVASPQIALQLNLVIDQIELPVDGAQVVIGGREHLLHEGIHQQIPVVFIDDLVLDFGPEDVHQRLDLQFEADALADGAAKSVDAVDGVAVVLDLRLLAAQLHADVGLVGRAVQPIGTLLGKRRAQGFVNQAFLFQKAALDAHADQIGKVLDDALGIGVAFIEILPQNLFAQAALPFDAGRDIDQALLAVVQHAVKKTVQHVRIGFQHLAVVIENLNGLVDQFKNGKSFHSSHKLRSLL